MTVNYFGLPSVLRRENKLYVPLLVTHVQLSGKVGMRHPPGTTNSKVIRITDISIQLSFFMLAYKNKIKNRLFVGQRGLKSVSTGQIGLSRIA